MEKNKENVHFLDKYLCEPTHPITISLIGCGGTGSLILPRLARLDFTLRELGAPGLHVTAYDGDTVQSHNRGRQNFVESDIGKYKSLCLMEKINFSYGLSWDAVNDFVNPEHLPHGNILITAVDNAEFRNQVHSFIEANNSSREYRRRIYWLDIGNGKDFGQAILSTVGTVKQPKKSRFNVVEKLRSIVDIYGDLKEFDNKETQGMESCSVADSIEEQDLFINDVVSVQAVNMLWRLLKDFFISHHGVIVNQKTLNQRGILIK